MQNFITRISALALSVVAAVQSASTAALVPSRRRVVARRGVTIIEYVLIAVVVIAVAAIFRDQLTSAIQTLTSRISSFLTSTK